MIHITVQRQQAHSSRYSEVTKIAPIRIQLPIGKSHEQNLFKSGQCNFLLVDCEANIKDYTFSHSPGCQDRFISEEWVLLFL